MSKTALIVDDSRSARVVLKRMLQTYDLQVDTSESAEEALEYLDGKRPDVIFMDHLMPGMDGFEAVTAIKKNPATAMIPIMMYTSQEGEVYVGQARALGAVGVLPKTVEPVEVSKILASLHLTDASSRVPDAGSEDAQQQETAAFASDGNLRDLLQDLFDQQREILQQELHDTYSDFTRKFARELKQSQEADREAGQEAEADITAKRNRWPLLLILSVVVFATVLFLQQNQVNRLQAENARLASGTAASLDPLLSGNLQRRIDGYRNAVSESRAALVDTLEWGVNQQDLYGWDEIPLNDRRVQIFDELLARLMAIGYVGEVGVAVHVGNFCMVDDGSGLMTLAPPTLDATACEQLGFDPMEALGIGSRQTVGFANFVVMAEEQSGGAIRFVIDSRGNTDPLITYPESRAGLDAEEWNDIAAINHRVTISLRPDTPPG